MPLHPRSLPSDVATSFLESMLVDMGYMSVLFEIC